MGVSVGMAISLEEGKLNSDQLNSNNKIDLVIHPARSNGLGKYILFEKHQINQQKMTCHKGCWIFLDVGICCAQSLSELGPGAGPLPSHAWHSKKCLRSRRHFH